jgi:hypothetical protein
MDGLFVKPGGRMLSYSVGYSDDKGHDFRLVVMAYYLVGDTGIEPVTSSVSGRRAPAAPIAREFLEENL